MDSKGHLSDPFQDVSGEEMLSSCWHAFHLNHIIEVKGNFLPKNLFLFLAKAPPVIRWPSSAGQLLAYYYHQSSMESWQNISKSARQRFSNSTLLEETSVNDRLSSFSLFFFFFSSTISVFGCRLPSFFFSEHLSAAKLGWGRSVVMV